MSEKDVQYLEDKSDKEVYDYIIDNQISEDDIIAGYSNNKSKYNKMKKELNRLREEMNNNNKKIEKIKLDLAKIKQEKKKQQNDIINLLSKKESIEEVYKNQIFNLNNSSEKNINNKKLPLFVITLEQFKILEINKYIEQVISMTDDILSKSNKTYDKTDINNNLKNIIKNSYELYRNNSSNNKVQEIITNFMSKISLYISNQSFGKYSESLINIFLRYLLYINVINKEIEKIGKFVNKQYKEKKLEYKNEIKNLENKNELYLKLYKEEKKAIEDIKNNANGEELHLQNFNFKINNFNSSNFKTENSKQNKISDSNNKNIIVDKQIDISYKNSSEKEKEINTDSNTKNEKSKKDKQETKTFNNKGNKEQLKNNNRLVKGKKIKREILYHNDNKAENNENLENNSFVKNLNYISDEESEDDSNKKSCSDEIKKKEFISMKDNNLIYQNKKRRINEIRDELELNENLKNKDDKQDKLIYNKKSIKIINKSNSKQKKEKLVNYPKDEEEPKKTNENINKNFNNKNSNEIKNSIINSTCCFDDSKNKIKVKEFKNERSHNHIFKQSNKIILKENNESKKSQSPSLTNKISFESKVEQNKNINDKKKNIYFNIKKKGVFSKSKINRIGTEQISLKNRNDKLNMINKSKGEVKNTHNKALNNSNLNSNENNVKEDSKNIMKNNTKTNEKTLKNLVKAIKSNLIKNKINNQKRSDENNINKEEKNNKENINIKINQNLAENIVNKLLSPRNNKANMNNGNLINYLNNKSPEENNRNNNLNKFITKNDIISNNINNNNEITLPFSNQPISNRISKLNLNIFITQNKENNDRISGNLLSEPEEIRKHNRSNYFNGNEVESDNVNNGISRENIYNPDENFDNGEKEDENTNKKNYRKLNLDRKLFEDRKNILINKKYFFSNRQDKRIGFKHIANKKKEITDINQEKELKSQYSLFYNSHEFSINNAYGDTLNRSKKKQNQLLIKNLSNSKNGRDKKKSNKNHKYIDLTYLKKFNNVLLKSSNSNESYTKMNENNKKNQSILSNTFRKNYKDIKIETDNSDNKKMIKNKNKKNQIKRYETNESETYNHSLQKYNSNINTISNNNNKINTIIFVNKTNDMKNKNTNNLKKLLEKKLQKIIPTNNTFNFNPKKIFAEGVMESFCYFKILDKDSPKFNPLDSYNINPESLGYSEGYISIDVILGHFRIIPKNFISKNFKSINNNSVILHNNSLSMAEYTLFNNGNNVFRFEIDKNEKKNCIRIDLKNIKEVKIKNSMQDIIKIHKIFLKYNSQSNCEYEDDKGRTKKRVLSINKLLYMKEISEINMDQNEKIKAALCNFFVFTIIFGNYKINKVECIFINYDLFNIWNKCLEMIAENNKKSKNSLLTHRELFHSKHNSKNFNNINN